MRNLPHALLFVTLFMMPAVACAHGSNVFEPADSSQHDASHLASASAHHDHAPGTLAEEVKEMRHDLDHLQEQLRAHDQRVRVTDIVGGIGYIVGIAGAACYYLATRRKKSAIVE